MIAAASLLGRPVQDNRGRLLGIVLDVGTGEQGSPKFLLVGPGGDPQPRVRRVEMRQVDAVEGEPLRLHDQAILA